MNNFDKYPGHLLVAKDGTIVACNSWARIILGLNDNEVDFGGIVSILGASRQRYWDKLVSKSTATPYKCKLNALCLTKSPVHLDVQTRQKPTSLGHYIELLCRFSYPETKTNGNISRNKITTHLQHKKDHLAFVSHEMRTPLNTLLGLLDVLNCSGLNQVQAEHVRRCQDASNYLLGLVDDILDGATLERGTFSLVEKKFDLLELIDNTMKLISYRASEKGLNLITAIEPEVPRFVSGDQRRLRQVILNLITNAIKFTDKGYIKFSVKLLELHTDSYLINFTVQDSGMGIARENRQDVFAPFKRLANAKTNGIEGSGLGLSIVKKIIEQMGGSISCESELNSGSTFSVELPLKTHTSPKTHLRLIQANTPATGLTTPNEDLVLPALKVILVDDSRDSCAVFKAYLAKTPVHLTCFNRAEEAIEYQKEHPVDAILMDIELPGIDGCTATQILRQYEVKANRAPTPIIALTGHVNPFITKKFVQEGGTDYLIKPIAKNQLIAALHKHTVHDYSAAAAQDIVNINKSELRHLALAFYENRQTDVRDLETALARADFSVIEKIGHRLKGDSRPYGFSFLEKVGAELETAAKRMNITKARALVEKIKIYLKEYAHYAGTKTKAHHTSSSSAS